MPNEAPVCRFGGLPDGESTLQFIHRTGLRARCVGTSIKAADDFELSIRAFLHTTMARTPVLGYLQYIEGGANTQRVRNQDIQRHVRYLRWKYDQRIPERFLALGLNDWVWVEEGGYSDLGRPNPEIEPVASIIVKL